jgi:hypothetical protein
MENCPLDLDDGADSNGSQAFQIPHPAQDEIGLGATVQALAGALAVSVEAFLISSSEGEPPGRGRPPKAKEEDAEPAPKRPRGRPRKAAGGQEDVQTVEETTDAPTGHSGTGKGKPKGKGKRCEATASGQPGTPRPQERRAMQPVAEIVN